MTTEKQAALITQIGEMIVEDPRYLANPWHAIGIAATVSDSGTEKMSGYRYLEDGSFEAGGPKEFGDLLDKLLELKAEMVLQGERGFQQCLIHITKPDYKLRLQFEFDDPTRWSPTATGMDMSAFATLLRPE